jgi:hypothetical protein
MTLSIMTLSIKGLFATFSIMTLRITTHCLYAKCHYAECRVFCYAECRYAECRGAHRTATLAYSAPLSQIHKKFIYIDTNLFITCKLNNIITLNFYKLGRFIVVNIFFSRALKQSIFSEFAQELISNHSLTKKTLVPYSQNGFFVKWAE